MDCAQGIVFDVERFSTKDGPGIRTAAFFKGCNLRCAWCHNREGIAFDPELGFSQEKCIGCGMCFQACPSGAHQLQDGVHVLDREKCAWCFRCADVCFTDALRVIGRVYTADELVELMCQDAEYYRNSDGGATLSGGEVMAQPEFALAVLRGLKVRGIHTAIETNLSVPWTSYERVLPYVDLVMADIKHIDSDMHRQYTGAGNELILQNAAKLFETDKPLILRTPVIPGFNDSPQTIAEIAEFVKSAKRLMYYELLSYHPLGTSKSVMIGEQPMRFETPSAGTMAQLGERAQAAGIPVLVNGKQIRRDFI